ncbi:MAG: FixH family protein [Magnetospirillum sp. WYHS-4]
MAAGQRPRGWWYPWIFVGGMAVVVAVNIFMMTMAVKTFPGLETQDAYQKGLAHNQTLAKARAQAERGWTAEVVFSPDAQRKGDLTAILRDRDGRPLDGFQVEATFVRPTVGGHDFKIDLAGKGGGAYAAPVTVSLSGQWILNLAARRGEETFEDSRKIKVP